MKYTPSFAVVVAFLYLLASIASSIALFLIDASTMSFLNAVILVSFITLLGIVMYKSHSYLGYSWASEPFRLFFIMLLISVVLGTRASSVYSTQSFISSYNSIHCSESPSSFYTKSACSAISIINKFSVLYFSLAPAVLAHTFNWQESSIKSEK